MTHIGRIITIALKLSPRSKESKSHTRLPSSGLLHKEDKTSEYLFLKARGAYFQETQRAVGNIHSILQEHTQNLMCSGSQGRGNNLKGA